MDRDKNYKRWSSSEIEYLKRNYGLLPAWLIAKHLNRSTNAIYCKAKRLGLRSFLRGSGRPPKFLDELLYNNQDD